jgi:iron complex outermembrane receptor protein
MKGQTTGGRLGVKAFAALLMSTALVSANVMALTAARAQERSSRSGGAAQERTFSIRPQSLPNALTIFGQQTGMQVSVDAAAARNLTSPGASGMMTSAVALNRLLAGTGLSYWFTGASTVVIGKPGSQTAAGGPPPPGAIPLDTINVQGAGNPNSTMTLMAPYAGGQVARGGQVGMLGNRSVMDTPFSQTIYTRKLIEDQQARALSDVLANESSIITSQGATGGTNEFWSFRGFMTQTYTGGHSLNGLPAMAPMQFPNTDWIERVEVLRGPGALLRGASFAPQGALGGSVNLVTKKAGDEPLTQLTTRYMSDSQFGAHVDLGRRFGDNKEFGIRFNGSLDGGDTAVETQQSRFRNAALNLDYRGDRVRLSADFAHQGQSLTAPLSHVGLGNVAGGLANLARVPRAPGTNLPLSPPWGRAKHEITLGMVKGEVDILDNVTAYGAIGKQRYDTFANVGNPVLLDSSGAIGLRSRAYRERYDVLSMQGGVRATADTGPIAHALSLDLSQVRYTASYTSQNRATGGVGPIIPVGTIYNPDFSLVPMPGDPGDPVKANQINLSSIGIADTLSILDERIQFVAGVRYQEIETQNFGYASGIVSAAGNYDASAWSPSFAVVVKPWENVSLYANYIENLQPGTSVSTNYANSGEVFAPYQSKQYEVGVKVDWGRVTTTLAAFQISQPSTLSVADPNGGLPTLELDGEQRNRGIELNAYGELFDGVRLLGGVTFLDARRTKTQNGTYDGARAAGAPDFRAVIGGEWDTPFIDRLTLTGRLTYTSDVVVANSAPNLTVPSWTQVDLGARYTFTSPWNAKPIIIRLNVDNVFDASYWKVLHVVGSIYKSNPRTYRLSTTFNF